MDIKVILLLIISIFHLIMAYKLFFREPIQTVRTAFALVLFAAALWSFGMAMFMYTLNLETAEFYARFFYFSAAAIPLFFLYFANYFIYPSYLLNERKIIAWLLPFLTITVIVFHPTFFIENSSHYDWGNDANVKLQGHLLYIIYFFSYIILAYRMLYKKFIKSGGVSRGILRIVIICTGLSYIFGIFFDLFLPIVDNYYYIHLGPYFTLFTLYALVYLLFIKK